MKIRITEITIMPANLDLRDPIAIGICNVGGGEEFVTIKQGPSDHFSGVHFQITEENWQHIRAGIDTMINLCNVSEEDEEDEDKPKLDPVFAKTDE
jgi:hypothetical protein